MYSNVIWGLYVITNKLNNKIYIGSAYNEEGIYKRWNGHLHFFRNNKHNRYFQNAWNKYGEDNFKFEVLLDLTEDVNGMDFNDRKNYILHLEQLYLDLFKPYDRDIGYNINQYAGGGGSFGEDNSFFGKSHTDEFKKEHSERMKELWQDETYLKNYYANRPDQSGENHPMYGYVWSEEQLQRRSEKMKGKNVGENNGNFGKPVSEERKKKQSETMKERGNSKGEKNPKAKLTYLQVEEVRRLLNNGELMVKDIAKIYNVHPYTISRIKTGKQWKNGEVTLNG